MNSFCLIKGFETYAEAAAYADRLPREACAKIIPYSTGRKTYAFAIDVLRTYTEGRI